MELTYSSEHYRPCVGVWIENDQQQLLVAHRLDSPGYFWQAPQGGIDPGEVPHQAMYRELQEEIGLGSNAVNIIAVSPRWIKYRLPKHLRTQLWGGRYLGQQQLWFRVRLNSVINALQLDFHNPPEFMAWKWIALDQLLQAVIPFKRSTYRQLLTMWQG